MRGARDAFDLRPVGPRLHLCSWRCSRGTARRWPTPSDWRLRASRRSRRRTASQQRSKRRAGREPAGNMLLAPLACFSRFSNWQRRRAVSHGPDQSRNAGGAREHGRPVVLASFYPGGRYRRGCLLAGARCVCVDPHAALVGRARSPAGIIRLLERAASDDVEDRSALHRALIRMKGRGEGRA